MSVDVFLVGTDIGSFVAMISKTSLPMSAYVYFSGTDIGAYVCLTLCEPL